MKPLMLVGAGGHCKACIDVIDVAGEFFPIGLVVPSKEAFANVDLPVLGADDDLPELLELHQNVLIAVGQIKSPMPRKKLFAIIKKFNGIMPVIKSPFSYCARNASVGEGTIVMHGSILNTSASVGVNCIINSRVLVEHEVKVGNHCHISTGAILNGGVTVGSGTFVGSGTVVKEGVQIGENTVIGAGNVVLKDICANSYLRKTI